jgi:hypothetical protein
MKAEKNKTSESPYIPQIPRSYSIDEILAAGGPVAFATKMGQRPEKIDDDLALLPDSASLTTDELNEALIILKESK